MKVEDGHVMFVKSTCLRPDYIGSKVLCLFVEAVKWSRIQMEIWSYEDRS